MIDNDTPTAADVAAQQAYVHLQLQRQHHERAAGALELRDYDMTATWAHRARQAGLQALACQALADELRARQL